MLNSHLSSKKAAVDPRRVEEEMFRDAIRRQFYFAQLGVQLLNMTVRGGVRGGIPAVSKVRRLAYRPNSFYSNGQKRPPPSPLLELEAGEDLPRPQDAPTRIFREDDEREFLECHQ